MVATDGERPDFEDASICGEVCRRSTDVNDLVFAHSLLHGMQILRRAALQKAFLRIRAIIGWVALLGLRYSSKCGLHFS